MTDTIDPKHIDRRTVERYQRSGALEEKVYEKYLKSLPDVASKAVPVESVVDNEEIDDEDDEA